MSEVGQRVIDNKGFTPDSQCGSCGSAFPVAVYSDGCPACDSGAVHTFLTKNSRVGIVGLGGSLPISVWEKRVLLGVRYAPPAFPKNFSNFSVDNQGFTPDSQCGNCKTVFAVAVYPGGCPVCGGKSIQTFLFNSLRKNIVGVGGLAQSLHEQRRRWGVRYVAPAQEKKTEKDIYNSPVNLKVKPLANGRKSHNGRSRKLKSRIRRRRLKLRMN